MILEDIGCLLIDNNRSRAYIQKMVLSGLLPSYAVHVRLARPRPANPPESGNPVEALVDRAFRARKYFLYDPVHRSSSLLKQDGPVQRRYASFDPELPVADSLAESGIPHTTVEAPGINAPEVVEAVGVASPGTMVFGGGGILKKDILSSGKRFIHVHPGIIPYFRGSHCIEWSVLMGERPGASAIFMNEGIDAGDVLATGRFDPPVLEDGLMPPLYSSHIRSELLIDLLRKYADEGGFNPVPQSRADNGIYYKMHPALANLVYHELGG